MSNPLPDVSHLCHCRNGLAADANISEWHLGNASAVYGIPVNLIRAIVHVESRGNPGAVRMEPPYLYLVNVATCNPFRDLTPEEMTLDRAPADFPGLPGVDSASTEWIGQQMSWGCMQIIGGTARWLGYRRAFGTLCHQFSGLNWGCTYLNKLAVRYLDDLGWPGVIAAWNAGAPRREKNGDYRNQHYVDLVREAGGFKRPIG